MNSNRWRTMFAGATLFGAIGLGLLAVADDEPASEKQDQGKAEEQRTEVRVVAIAGAGKHWIGVHAIPVADEALKSQLNIQDRLIVVQVIPDSPSAKAGVQQHDILLKFGDQDLHTLEDLIKAVNDGDGKEAKLFVLRGAKEQTLTVQPSERPTDDAVAKFHVVQPQDLRFLVEQAAKGDDQGKYTLRMLGPGIAAGAVHRGTGFPNGMSISVSKENDQPAKIVAKKDGKTYETTGDKLGELPAEIREHVERLLHTPHAMTWSSDVWKQVLPHSDQVREEVKRAVESAKKQRDVAEEAANTARRHVERYRVEGPIEGLRKELDALRKEVEKLKGQSKDAPDESGEGKSGKE